MRNFWNNLILTQIFVRQELLQELVNGLCYLQVVIMMIVYPRNIRQKELEDKKFVFLSNKNNLSFVHRQFSATLWLYLNPKKHIPLHIILHLHKGLSPLKCGRGNPANYQHQPTSWQPQRKVPGETNLCPTLIPTL